MRPSEAFKLTWGDVCFERNSVLLKDTKNGDTYLTPLIGSAMDVLAKLSTDDVDSDRTIFRGTQKGLNAQFNIGRAVLKQ